MVVVNDDRNRRALCRGDKRGGDERKVAVGEQHFGRPDDDGAARFLRRGNRRLEHVGVVRVEKPDGVLFRLCFFKNLVEIYKHGLGVGVQSWSWRVVG